MLGFFRRRLGLAIPSPEKVAACTLLLAYLLSVYSSNWRTMYWLLNVLAHYVLAAECTGTPCTGTLVLAAECTGTLCTGC